MNKKRSIILNLIIFIFVFCLMIPTEVKAVANSYTDAKTFYETVDDTTYHVDFADMSIYYATKAKSASSSKSLRYQTIGWQIRLEANGQSISVDVKRGGSYLQEVNEEYSTDGYCYSLYKINYNQLCDLASKKNPTAWNSMKTASTIYVYMDAIFSWKNPGSNTPAGDKIDPLTGQISKDNIFSVERVYGVKRFEVSSLKAPVDEFGLRKTGYRIVPGKEWKTADSTKYFNTASTYATTDINVAAATQSSSSIEFVANWEPKTYIISIDQGVGSGGTNITNMKYVSIFADVTEKYGKREWFRYNKYSDEKEV